jgi:hypothetical protein
MTPQRPVPGHNNYFGVLQRHLTQGEYEVAACGPNTPTVAEIDAFAAEVGVHLPFDFVDFSVSRIGGIRVAVKEEIWPRPKVGDVGPFWTMLYGLWVYGFAAGIPEHMDIKIQTKAFRDRSGLGLTPCLKIIGDANIYCFNPDGSICRWDHETGACPTEGKTFLEVLDFELSQLADRKNKYAQWKSPKQK